MMKLASLVLRKRLLLGLAAGATVFATTYGAAATLGVGSASLGAGNVAVASCDDSVSTSYTTAYDAALPGYKVTGVTVTGIDPACNGRAVGLTLTGTGNTVLATASGAYSSAGGSTQRVFSAAELSAQPGADKVTGVYAVIAG